jgi:tetratricopeptide (TPR) repeat protein
MDRNNLENAIATEQAKPLASADNIAFWILLVGILLLPFVFYPIAGASVIVIKKFFLLGVILAAFLFWVIGRLQEGTWRMPLSSVIAGAFLLPLSFLVSALFSGSIRHSIIGAFYQPETVLSALFLWVLMVLVIEFFSDRHRLFNFYIGFCVSGLLFGLYTLVRFLLGPVLPMNIANFLPVSLLGSWYENGIFLGLVTIFSVLMLEFFSLEKAKILKFTLNLTIAVSILCLILINYSTAWLVIGLLTLAVFIYFTFLKKGIDNNKKKILIRPSSIVLGLSVIFFMLSGVTGPISTPLNSIYNKFQFSFLEVRPGFSSTADVIKGVANDSPLFGVGPNNFPNAWTIYRPKFVNELQYWNVNFSNSFGILPTYIVTAGLLGVLAMLLFFGSLLYSISKAVLVSKKDPDDILGKMLLGLASLGTLYLWLMLAFYTPNVFGLPMAFIMTGLLVATMVDDKVVKTKLLLLYKTNRSHFISISVLVILLIGTLVLSYSLIQKFLAVTSYSKGAEAMAVGNIDEANIYFIKTLNADSKNPLYLRTFSSLKLQELNRLLSTESVEKEETSAKMEALIDAAVTSAQEASRLNPLDYQNFQVLAGVYEFLASININQAYESAKVTYEKALSLNPNNPELLLNMARLEIGQNNFEEARALLEKALTIKTNYASSIVLLSQLDVEDGNTTNAINRLESALAKNPYDTNLLFQLGLLSYRNGNYVGAIESFKNAVAFSQGGINANASYFLGLSYAENGQRSLAVEQFEIIQKFNPDNAEVNYILANLKAGRSALSGLSSGQNVQTPALEQKEADEEVVDESESSVEVAE